MAMYQRREIPGRTRFLLALSLSTVTAVGVAAPLALQALRADDQSNIASLDPTPDEPVADDGGPDLTIATESDGIGGIGSRSPAKGQGQTTKTESGDGAEVDSPDESVLTNPSEPQVETTTTPTTEPIAPAPEEETTSTSDTTSTTEDPVATPTTEETTSTTDDETTSTTEDESTSTTEDLEPTVPATEEPGAGSSTTSTSDGAGG